MPFAAMVWYICLRTAAGERPYYLAGWAAVWLLSEAKGRYGWCDGFVREGSDVCAVGCIGKSLWLYWLCALACSERLLEKEFSGVKHLAKETCLLSIMILFVLETRLSFAKFGSSFFYAPINLAAK